MAKADVNSLGNFFVDANGRRRAVQYSAAERLAVNVPYSRLQAFPAGGGESESDSGPLARRPSSVEALAALPMDPYLPLNYANHLLNAKRADEAARLA